MGRTLAKRLAVALAALQSAACSVWMGADVQPGRHELTSYCGVLERRPAWRRAVLQTWQRWGTPPWVSMAFIYQESRFDPRAKPGADPEQAGAYGYAQAIDSTWNHYRRQTGNRSARRDDFGDAADFIGWYNKGTQDRLGIRLTDARRLYLAYHEGRGGYEKGTYKKRDKKWLREVAHKVAKKADSFHAEHFICGTG